jgi:hypothetical protein
MCCSAVYYAQKDTVYVDGYYSTNPGVYGTLNAAIDKAIADGTINNTVFKLKPYDIYVLSKSIYLDKGQNLEIVAPKAGTTQQDAPPQIVWTEEAITRSYVIQSYGDVTLKNIWIRFADFTGNRVSSSISMENQDGDDPEIINCEGCIFDYNGIGTDGGGTINCKCDHFQATLKDCYFRNNCDNHFKYYGRAISFPYQSTGWHYDSILFENCTFSNISRVVMIEGNEYGDNVQLNHCTVLNTIEWVLDTNGWNKNMLVSNSIIINPDMEGYKGTDVCTADQTYDDFLAGACSSPNSGLLQITPVAKFGFEVPFTDQDRKYFIGNTAYLYQDFMSDWFVNCGWCKEQHKNRNDIGMVNPAPMLAKDEMAILDSVDGSGNKAFTKMNVDKATIYTADPNFIQPATNQDTMLMFVEYKWSTAADIDWSYEPGASFAQKWPLPENMAYNNETYKTAGMGGFPIGDLNWWPEQKANWEKQRDKEWNNINSWLDNGKPYVDNVKELNGSVPSKYTLQQNYPNPFNPTTNIKYSVPASGFITLNVYNSLGQLVSTIFSGNQKAGNYVAEFNASNLASGVYMYQLKAGNVSITKKFVLEK